MQDETRLYETNLYRCLVYQEKQTDDIYLTLCGVEKCVPGYEFHTEKRPGYHLHVILAGKGSLWANGTLYPLHFGQMFMTKPGEDAWYRADETNPWGYCWMTFDGNNAAGYAESAGFRAGTYCRDCNVDQEAFFSLVRQLLDRPEMTQANDLRRLGLLLEFLARAIESNAALEPAVRRRQTDTADVYVDYATAYIKANFAAAKVSDVARYIGIHRSYLSSIFKKKMGVSPQEYLMQCRMDRANKLLLETEAPIQEIAQRVGYDNALTFSKIFKSYYGVSPRKYRSDHRDAT